MKKSLFVGTTLVGLMTLSALPALADEPDTTVITPGPVVVQQPAPQPAAPVVVHTSDRDEGARPTYPGLTWGGVAVWGMAYSAAAITAAAADDACDASSRMCIRGSGVLWAPVVGPFIALGGVEGKAGTTMKTLLAIDGAFQLGGVAMTITGLVLSASAASSRSTPRRPGWSSLPTLARPRPGWARRAPFSARRSPDK